MIKRTCMGEAEITEESNRADIIKASSVKASYLGVSDDSAASSKKPPRLSVDYGGGKVNLALLPVDAFYGVPERRLEF